MKLSINRFVEDGNGGAIPVSFLSGNNGMVKEVRNLHTKKLLDTIKYDGIIYKRKAASKTYNSPTNALLYENLEGEKNNNYSIGGL